MAVAAKPQTKTKRAGEFLSSPRKLLINNQWVDAASGKTFAAVNPATGDELVQVAEGDKADIDKAVAAARKAFDSGPWRKMRPNERTKLLWKLSELILANQDALAELESLDNGKPFTIAKAVDVAASAEQFQYMAGWATKVDGRTMTLSAPGTFAYTLREPVGVCGQIIPWNFPLLMAAWKLAPALAAGNCVVLKPAEQTPLTALLLGELCVEAGFPAGVVNVVTGFGETAGAALSGHKDVNKVAFTGSTEVGKIIMRAASGNLKKVTLELGGKAPNIVFSDADMGAATAGAAMAIFFNQGQVCCAGSRLYVEKKSFDTVVGGLCDAAKNMKLAPGMDPACQMGPLVSDEQLTRVTGFVERGKKAGATALVGGEPAGGNGYFYKPTVLTNVKPDMEVVREEIFGPVVVASPFDDLDELARQANDTPYGLSAGIWTQDIKKAHAMAGKLQAGTVWINCYNVFDPHLPFGGYKESGLGREMGPEVLEHYTQVKAVVVGGM